MNNNIEDIQRMSKKEKIKFLESLTHTNEKSTLQKIISLLDDPDIEIRGEVFSVLVLNKNDISEILIERLQDENKNVRAFTALILGNRKDQNSIESLIKLTYDERSTVRSCALGSLGYLKASKAEKVIHNCFRDKNVEVKKSALKAAIDIDSIVSKNDLQYLKNENDDDLKKMIQELMK